MTSNHTVIFHTTLRLQVVRPTILKRCIVPRQRWYYVLPTPPLPHSSWDSDPRVPWARSSLPHALCHGPSCCRRRHEVHTESLTVLRDEPTASPVRPSPGTPAPAGVELRRNFRGCRRCRRWGTDRLQHQWNKYIVPLGRDDRLLQAHGLLATWFCLNVCNESNKYLLLLLSLQAAKWYTILS